MLRHKRLVEADTKLKQLEAVKALIATSNHEFNNALFISNGFLKKLDRKLVDDQAVVLNKVIEMNKRMESIVKKLESLKDINFTDKATTTSMLKI